jgi:putative ABC transport system ATP-binding protein
MIQRVVMKDSKDTDQLLYAQKARVLSIQGHGEGPGDQELACVGGSDGVSQRFRINLSPKPLSLVEVQQAHKHYHLGDTTIHALRGIDLEIHRGEFVAVWGPSGSGKSTLCHLVGVIDEPDGGKVMVEGQDVHALSDDAKTELRNRYIGFMFQNFNLIPVLSALENVMLPLQMQGVDLNEARKRSLEKLEQVGLESHVDHRPSKLSGGQRQRVAIARALITGPDLVIADEPTANLDSHTAHRIIDLMREVNQQTGAAFVFSTHDHRLLERVDRRVEMLDGKIVQEQECVE